jgi:hypothetical protein
MNKLFSALIVLLAVASGCGDHKDSQAPQPPMPIASLKNAEGFQSLAVSELSVIVIHLEQNNLYRSYFGDEVVKVAQALRLDHPKVIGSLGGQLPTGQVTVTYKTASGKYDLRKFTIINDKILVDQSFAEVAYSAAEPITAKWLEEVTK